jgi:signal transduction histidine kinase
MALSLGIEVDTLRVYKLIPSNGFTLYAVQIGTTIEVLLMAMALSELLRHEHNLHIATKDQAMQSQVALLEVTRSSEEKLKQAVEERTLQLAVSLQQEKQLREQYVRFGSMISHEFRTPLAIIQSQLSVMRKEYKRGIDQVEPRLEAIGSATNRLSDMFEKWLHSDALSQTLDVMELKPLDLQPWLQSQLNESRHLLVHQTLSFEQQTESCLVRADAYHLSIVLNNLLDNAAKYSPAGSTITVGLQVLNNHIGLFVSDQGVGIPSPMLEKIFNEFFRVSPESSVRGVGLGLSIVKRIVLAHGGEVQVRSLPVKGTVFTVWLPTLQRDKHE